MLWGIMRFTFMEDGSFVFQAHTQQEMTRPMRNPDKVLSAVL